MRTMYRTCLLCTFLLFAQISFGDLITAQQVLMFQSSGNSCYFSISQASDGSTGQQWVSNAPNGNAYYFNNNQPNPILFFDLGSSRSIDGLSVWGYNVEGNSLQNFTMSFYNDYPSISNPAPVYSEDFSLATYTSGASALTLSNSVTARYAVMEMTSNFKNTNTSAGGGDRVGFSELQFDVTPAAVITPTSAKMLAGTDESSVSRLIDGNTSVRWYTNANNPDYYNNGGVTPVIEFGFDSAQTLSSINISAYDVAGNSARSFTLDFFDQAGNQITVDDPAKYSFNLTGSTTNKFSQLLFPEVSGVYSVKMTVTDNYRDTMGKIAGGDRVGLSEVSFGNDDYVSKNVNPVKYNAPLDSAYRIARPDAVSINNIALDYGRSDASLSLNNLINDTGLSGGSSWCTIANGGDYFSLGAAPELTFTFDENAPIEGFSIWGYGAENGSKGNGLTQFSLNFYDDNQLQYSDTYLLDMAINASQFATFELPESLTVDTVVMSLMDNAENWFMSYGNEGGDRVGFSGIAFYQDPARVPEPSTWAMLVLGCVAIGYFRRRRTANKTELT